MHGETISRWVNQLDGLLLRCFVCALLATLSFVHATCRIYGRGCKTCFIVVGRCPWDSWNAWFVGLHACMLEELPHCIPRNIPGKGEVLHPGAGGNDRSQLMVLVCCIWFHG